MQCTAISKAKKRAGLPIEECRCQRRAVKGYTVCQMHGAGSPYKGRPGGRPLKTGMYSKKASKELRTLYEEFLNDENLTSLDDDVAILRSLLAIKLSKVDPEAEQYDKDGKPNPHALESNLSQIRDLSRDIRYTIQQKNDIMSQYMIPIENVQLFLQNVMLVLSSNITDKELLGRIVEELQGIRIMETDIYQQARYINANKRK